MAATRVLVADAQYLFADALATALDACADVDPLPHRPTNAVEAIAAVTTARPGVALVDYWLPDMEGPAATRSILARVPQTRVLLLSWFHGPPQIEAGLAAGAVGFLPKSLAVAQVAEGVRRAAGGEHPVFGEELAAVAAAIAERGRYVELNARRFAALSPRELEVLRLLGGGLTADDIAQRLDIAEPTVRTHVHKILAKTDARSQLEAVAMARDVGILP